MDAKSMLPVVGLLVLAVVVVIVLLRIMRARHASHDRPPERAEPQPRPPQAPAMSKEEQDMLDSSHIGGPIVPGGRDALETWRSNKRN